MYSVSKNLFHRRIRGHDQPVLSTSMRTRPACTMTWVMKHSIAQPWPHKSSAQPIRGGVKAASAQLSRITTAPTCAKIKIHVATAPIFQKLNTFAFLRVIIILENETEHNLVVVFKTVPWQLNIQAVGFSPNAVDTQSTVSGGKPRK